MQRLRCCCELMRRTSPDVISGLSLTIPLPDRRDSALSILHLAERMSEEYDVRALVRLDGRSLTVRLFPSDIRKH